ncbi:hypothetical protein BVX98_03375 [bacterium F11]|nr:hypothetical protein BVX98_03375 [bacterium F11]
MSEASIPTDALEGLMRKVFLEKKVEPGLFWDAILKAPLFVPLADSDKQESGSYIEHGERQWAVQLGIDSKGRNIFWLFTSPAVMTVYTERKFSHLSLSGQDMFDRIKEITHEIILVGPDDITLSLDLKLVQSLASGKVPQPNEGIIRHMQKDAQVSVGNPSEETEQLEERFIKLFEEHPEVEQASFVQISDETGSRLLLGLRMKEENRDTLRTMASYIAKAAEGILERGKTIDITFISGSLKGAFEKWGKNFYRKL